MEKYTFKRMKKKSLVGWAQRESTKSFKFRKTKLYDYLFITSIFKGKSHFKSLCMGEAVKVRITIEEI